MTAPVRAKPSSQRPLHVVTGGAGFVGSNLVAGLLAREPRPHILVIDSLRTGSFANIVEACERRGVGAFDGEVRAETVLDHDWEWLAGRFAPSAVFHLAA